jgi:hypothetical protein
MFFMKNYLLKNDNPVYITALLGSQNLFSNTDLERENILKIYVSFASTRETRRIRFLLSLPPMPAMRTKF